MVYCRLNASGCVAVGGVMDACQTPADTRSSFMIELRQRH